jgi:hypothetical protein
MAGDDNTTAPAAGQAAKAIGPKHILAKKGDGKGAGNPPPPPPKSKSSSAASVGGVVPEVDPAGTPSNEVPNAGPAGPKALVPVQTSTPLEPAPATPAKRGKVLHGLWLGSASVKAKRLRAQQPGAEGAALKKAPFGEVHGLAEIDHAVATARDSTDIDEHNAKLCKVIESMSHVRVNRQAPLERTAAPSWYGEEASSVQPVSEDAAAAMRQFTELQRAYDVHPAVVQMLICQSGLRTVDDFRLCFEGNHTAANFEEIVIHARRLTGAAILYPAREATNLARAWAEINSCHSRAVTNKLAPPDTADEDDPVPAKELRSYRARFWDRYKMGFSSDEFTPGDKLLSQVARALARRTLTFKDLNKVMSLKEESGVKRISRKVGDTGLQFTMQETIGKTTPINNLPSFLERLELWLNALAIIGAEDVDDPPKDEFGMKRAQTPEDLPCVFTKIPWMQIKDYLSDIKRFGELVNQRTRFDWVRQRNAVTLEHACKSFRESTYKTFGRCLRDACDLYVAMWQPDVAIRESGRQSQGSGSRSSANKGKGKGTSKKGARLTARNAVEKRTKQGKGRKKEGKGKSKGGAKPGTGFKDGTAVCAAWNSGKCSNEEPCPNGKHVCNTLLKNGRICGFSNHNRLECTNKSKK